MAQPDETEAPDLMKPEQLAADWQVAVDTLARHRTRGTGPPFLHVLGSIRYSRRAVADWLEAQQAGDVA